MTTNTGTNVVVSWPLTPNERGQPVTEYRIKFKSKDGGFYETSSCDGTSSTILTSRTCTIAMSVFTSSPFNLIPHDLISGIVEAKNSIGYSLPSLENTSGALVSTAPL